MLKQTDAGEGHRHTVFVARGKNFGIAGRNAGTQSLWEAGLMFEETEGTLLCSDLLTHEGEVEPLTESDVVGRFRQGLVAGQQGPWRTPTLTRRGPARR